MNNFQKMNRRLTVYAHVLYQNLVIVCIYSENEVFVFDCSEINTFCKNDIFLLVKLVSQK